MLDIKRTWMGSILTLSFWTPLLPASTMAGPGKENRVLQLGIWSGVVAVPERKMTDKV